MPYTQLDHEKISDTLSRLQARVTERFPDRGISNVCAELLQISRQQQANLQEISHPHVRLRTLVGLVLAAGLVMIGWGIFQKVRLLTNNPGEIYSFEGVEAIVNITLLVSAGVWFLLNLETRIKREQALKGLHQLRSIAHVIDMHQLTKDPVSPLNLYQRTKSSPERDLTVFQLIRYLDYCAEMLSLTGKLAALYVQTLNDSAVADTVNEIEDLTASLSQKVWQKVMIIRLGITNSETHTAGASNEAPAL
ncbi:hypothetical protein [Hyphomonas sp.]|uniref:hypothetical protein n=1 Tax=Hyphomonas sp. TaxID=87 RepID=UPI0025BCF714|nr:hypothetical protein [Hyphomonas sp.]